MRKEGKHIDEVFREGLMNLNVIPPAGAWETVEQKISRRKTFVAPLLRLAAASLLLMTIIGSFWLIFLRKPMDRDLADQPGLSDKTTVVKPVTPVPGQMAKTGKQKQTERPAFPEEKNTVVQSQSLETWQPLAGVRPEIQQGEVGTAGPEQPARAKELSNEVEPMTTEPMRVLQAEISPLPTNPEMSLAYRRTLLAEYPGPADKFTEESQAKGDWSIGGNFGPFYTYRTLAATEPNYSRYLNNQESGLMNYSGGLTVFYSGKNGRFSIQTGLGYARIGQVADDIIAFRSIKTGDFALLQAKGNDYIHVSEGRLGYDEHPVFIANRTSPDGMEQADYLLTQVGTGLYETVNVSLKQDIRMLEIPLLLRYNLLDKDIDLSVLGGVGSSILLEGKSLIAYGGDETLLGRTADLRRANLNGIFGLGFSYKVSGALSLHLEPTLKYYLNPVNKYSSVRAHPYSVGVYSGVSWTF